MRKNLYEASSTPTHTLASMVGLYIFSAIWGHNVSHTDTPDAIAALESYVEPVAFSNIAVIGWIQKSQSLSRRLHYRCCIMLEGGTIKSFTAMNAGFIFGAPLLRATRLNCESNVNPYTVRGINIANVDAACPNVISRYVTVDFPKYSAQTKNQLAICSKIAYGNLNAQSLIEWLEVHTLLGADKILLFTYKLNVNATKVLQYYARTGLVEFRPFDLPARGKLVNIAVFALHIYHIYI